MNNKKAIFAITIASGLVFNLTAFANFRLVEEDAEKKPLTPVQVVTERQENKRLRKKLASTRNELKLARIEAKNANDKLEAVQLEKIIVAFAFGSSDFISHPNITDKLISSANHANEVNVRGYTDNIGTDMANKQLAHKRAESIKKYLVSRRVSEAKIKIFAEPGEYIASNKSEAGRAVNRRVEIEFMK